MTADYGSPTISISPTTERIFFSEATIRYEMDREWPVDGPGGARQWPDHLLRSEHRHHQDRVARTEIPQRHLHRQRPTVDPVRRNLRLLHPALHWFDGPKTGKIETVIDNLPGYPDNINLASDGSNYWLAMVGMRSPALDLAWKMPGFRRRMGKRVPIDEWLFPNINTGCVIKFNERGEVLDSLWDLRGVNHPMITSMREHRGYLYLGGIANNRIGRYKLDGADPNFIQYDRRWGRAT